MSIAGEPKSIKNLKSGDKESHKKSILQMKTFCGLKCSITPHSSLNTSKGIIRCPALSRVTSDDIKALLNRELRMYVESLYVVMVKQN